MIRLRRLKYPMDSVREFMMKCTLPSKYGKCHIDWLKDSRLKLHTLTSFSGIVLALVPIVYLYMLSFCTEDARLTEVFECVPSTKGPGAVRSSAATAWRGWSPSNTCCQVGQVSNPSSMRISLTLRASWRQSASASAPVGKASDCMKKAAEAGWRCWIMGKQSHQEAQ